MLELGPDALPTEKCLNRITPVMKCEDLGVLQHKDVICLRHTAMGIGCDSTRRVLYCRELVSGLCVGECLVLVSLLSGSERLVKYWVQLNERDEEEREREREDEGNAEQERYWIARAP